MISFTLENLKRDISQDNLFNIFKQTYVDSDKLQILTKLVKEYMGLGFLLKN